MGFNESRVYLMMQDMLSCYFYPGEESIEDVNSFAERLRIDNSENYVQELHKEISLFLRAAGNKTEEMFHKEFLSYFSPVDQTVGEWLTALNSALADQHRL